MIEGCQVESRVARGVTAALRLYVFLVNSDLLCDVFLSIRILFLAYMVMCTEMITTWVRALSLIVETDLFSDLSCKGELVRLSRTIDKSQTRHYGREQRYVVGHLNISFR